MRYLYLLVLICFLSSGCRYNPSTLPANLDLNQPQFSSYADFEAALETIEQEQNEARRDSLLDALWTGLRQTEQIPFTHGENIAFLYRGDAEAVTWHGDFDRWGGSKNLFDSSKGKRVGETDLWILEKTLPADARLDYKIVVGEEWIKDPNNPHETYSGFGNNSELRMPEWEPDPIIEPDSTVPRGTLHPAQRFSSTALGYDVLYEVYTPAGYDSLTALPSLYVSDGQDYLSDQMGGLTVTLDNVIAAGDVSPLVLVFIDTRDPDRLDFNKREEQFLMNPNYARFIAEELVPVIDNTYATAGVAETRGILGTSYGGMNGAYVVAQHPETFHLAALQSPAFWPNEEIYKRHEAANLPLKVFMSSGTINDVLDQARKMKQIFEKKGYPMQYLEVNEGHSWNAWRPQLDDVLRFLYPAA